MRRRTGILGTVGLAALVCGLVLSAPAGAVTVGQIASAGGGTCPSGFVFAQPSSVAPSYTIPAGGGVIDRWSMATFGASAGASVSLLVLTPLGSAIYQVDSFDTKTLPTPLPLPSGTPVTFTPAAPIYAPAGAVLGLYGGTSGAECLFPSSPSDQFFEAGSLGAPANGGTYTFPGSPITGSRLNVAANLIQSVDAGLTTAAHPAVATVGGIAAFTFSLTNTGVSTGTASFSDSIPNGLSIVSAVSGSGACSTLSQLVSCSVALAPGASVPVSIVVSTSTAGTFTNTGAVTTSLADPNPADNAATASLTVQPAASAPAASCHVIALKNLPLAVAKSVLTALSCRPGAVSNKSSKSVPKGSVISTSPGPGSHPAGTKVKLTVSSGRPKKHHRPKKHR